MHRWLLEEHISILSLLRRLAEPHLLQRGGVLLRCRPWLASQLRMSRNTQHAPVLGLLSDHCDVFHVSMLLTCAKYHT